MTGEWAEAKGNIFGCPDGLAFDARGVLWIQTDAHATQMYKGEFARIGNNQMLACDVASGEVRRFLTGPTHCEVTGVTFTPDMTTMFVNIQHPGETPSDRCDPMTPVQCFLAILMRRKTSQRAATSSFTVLSLFDREDDDKRTMK